MKSRSDVLGFIVCAVTWWVSTTALAGVLGGHITDLDSGEPVGVVTIRVVGTGQSMLSNDDGEYRIRLAPGTYTLRFSHVAYYSTVQEVTVADEEVNLDVQMKTSVIRIPGTTVYDRAYDPGQRIILQAIEQKQALLNRLQNYSFDAYTKLIVRDRSKDSANILLITETQVESFWERPDKHKEIIIARRQSSNLNAEDNLVAVGGILDFNANRLDIGRYEVVSPTAEDALDYYNYYLIDTVFVDSLPVFRLEIEPRNNYDPLLVGTIDIADSSFAVVGVDVGFGAGIVTPFLSRVRFYQSFAQFDTTLWMPVQIGFSGDLDLSFPGIPPIDFDYQAALTNFEFDQGHPGGTFDEFVLEVDERADDIDSTAWFKRQVVPLTEEELDGYQRIDSLQNVPPRWYQIGARVLFGALFIATNGDFVRFNRVEDLYLGLPLELRPTGDIRLSASTGYSFGQDIWEHEYRAQFRLKRDRRLFWSFGWRNEVTHRPMFFKEDFGANSLYALWGNKDPYEYYRERGFFTGLRTKVIPHVDVAVRYRDYYQSSLHPTTDYGFFTDSGYVPRNLPIADGRLRSFTAMLFIDTRPMIRNKQDDERLTRIPFATFSLSVEHADPELVKSDFDYTRYRATFTGVQRTLGFGLTYLQLKGGWADRVLPPQAFFTANYAGAVDVGLTDFKTTNDANFSGNRAFSYYLAHDFGRWLFRRSGLPLVKDIPASLYLYGGQFWTEFAGPLHDVYVDHDDYRTASDGLSEIGFGVGNLGLPWLRFYFTWQLTHHDGTNAWSWNWAVNF